ncbi:MAG: T9SS type A sorting domain-containing protein [Ignavibacteria bacterium]|nr:T9SS type A sorting domain-containing protein [Ignavibacteria bacterium]
MSFADPRAMKMRGRRAMLCALPLFALAAAGCLTKINSISAPAGVAVDESFTVAIDGVISGEGQGVAGIVLQVPESFEFVGASCVATSARRRLRYNEELASRFTAEAGHTVIAVVDTIRFSREKSDNVRVFITLRPTETGTFTLKCTSGGMELTEEEGRWRTHDPAGLRDFASFDTPNNLVTVTVTDQERNGTAALSFSGAREYLALPDSGVFAFTMRADFSVECWVSTTVRDVPILSTRQDDFLGAFPLEIGIDDRGAAFVQASDGDSLYRTHSSVFIADGRWHHLAAVYASATRSIELYADARFIETLFLPESIRDLRHAPPLIGARPTKRRFFAGTIDELRFWSAVRSQEEIIFYKQTALSGFEKNLAALYTFENGQNGRIPNATGAEGFEAVAFNKPKIIASTAPLRVELLSFGVTMEGGTVDMAWESYDESKVRHFQVEKRTEEGKYAVFATFEAGQDGQNHRVYHATDEWSEKTIVYYRLRKVNADGSIVFSDEVPIGAEQVMNFSLGENQPNPFGSVTEIPYTLSEPTHVSIRVYDLMGREVEELVSERQGTGSYKALFDGSELPAGLYFVKMRTAAGSQTKKIFLSR